MDIVIYHNPECGTSRNVLAIIEAAGYTPTVVEYLKTGWTKPQLLGLFAAAGLTPRSALRETKSPAAELGLLKAGVSSEVILDAMIKHPILVNRPIVCTVKGVRLCRPSETVLIYSIGCRLGHSIRKTGNCSSIVMGAALPDHSSAPAKSECFHQLGRYAESQYSVWVSGARSNPNLATAAGLTRIGDVFDPGQTLDGLRQAKRGNREQGRLLQLPGACVNGPLLQRKRRSRGLVLRGGGFFGRAVRPRP